MTWIADGEAGSSVRAKLNALMIPISSVAISSPVEYVDIALPSGYGLFFFAIAEISTDGADAFSFALSSNGGSSFLTSYLSQVNGGVSSIPVATGFPDVLAKANLSDAALMTMWLSKGSQSQNIAIGQMGSADSTSFAIAVSEGSAGPFNLIRWLPYGNGDNPPTSGQTLISGVFNLFGIRSA